MAEIKIEKKSTPIWPWILLGVALLALLIYLFSSRDEGNGRDEITEVRTEESSYASSSREVTGNNSAVLAFVSFIREDPDQMGLDHRFTNEALSRLTSATNAMADKVGYNVQQDMSQVRTHTDKITKDPFETTHANSIREATGSLATALKNIQQKAFPGLASDADKVKNASTAIKANVLTLDQKKEVKNFFKESAQLLEKMNSNSPKQ
ncbi:hypothetical protein [Algoriphagus sp.]|uniref:hypothetical protein n=1 Tax=Algoriphagus sp. TaxID=1872435 RepID=UPI0039195EB4